MNLLKKEKVHDEYRISYLRDHIKAIKRAMEKGLRSGLTALGQRWIYCPQVTESKNVTVLSMLIGLMMIRKIALVSRKTLFIGIKRLSSLMEKIYDCESFMRRRMTKKFSKKFFMGRSSCSLPN